MANRISPSRWGSRTFPLLLVALVVAGMPRPARALNVCNALLQIDYASGSHFPNPGDTVRVRLTLGTGSITGVAVPSFRLNRVRFDLDCATPPAPGAVPCADDGNVMQYAGDATISTTCGVTFTTGHGVGPTPNEIVFTPSAPLVMPAERQAFCTLEFDVAVVGPSNDATPTFTEQVAGYNASSGDGMCNNGLASSGAQSGSIPLCPRCDDRDSCTVDTCDAATGRCLFSAPVLDCVDDDSCTADRCDGSAPTPVCRHDSAIDCADQDSCTADRCDGSAPAPVCRHDSAIDCTDQDSCTIDRCDGSAPIPVCRHDDPAIDCNDDDSCTIDRCDGSAPTPVCRHDDLVIDCNDNDSCTADRCDGSAPDPVCRHDGPVLDCDDQDSCTPDQCDGSAPTPVCRHGDPVLDCDDHDSCTPDRCDGSAATPACRHGDPILDCEDDDACTRDRCDGSAATPACRHDPAVECDDADACTTERCNPQTGMCEDTGPLDCSDTDACTDDRCDPATGCAHPAVTCPDSDGNPCTLERCNPATGLCELAGTGGASVIVRRQGRFGNISSIDGTFGASEVGGMIQLGKGSFVTNGNVLVADTVNLGVGANVFRVLANTVHSGRGVIIRGGTGRPMLPIQNPFCPIPTINCSGGQMVIVSRAGSVALSPSTGAYGPVLVKNEGVLTIAGPGTFTLCSLLAARNAAVVVTGAGPTTINVAGDFRIANGGTFGPAPGSPFPVVNVNGSVLRVGAAATVTAVMSAPHAQLRVGRSGNLQGVFCVESSSSDKGISLTCPPPVPSPSGAFLDPLDGM